MSLPIVLRDEAQVEFDEAFDYDEGQKPGLGVAFVGRVQEVLDRIAVNPHLHAAVLGDVRKAVVTRFPYCVYYRAEAARIQVLAVFHPARDPSVWQSRI